MSEAVAPPSRPLLAVTLIILVAFTVLRFITAATLDLRTDEAYYWTWAHEYVLSYLDQPPMVAWVERLGIALLGDTPLGVRFGQLLMLPLIELILADIARRRTASWNAALFVVLAMECTLNYGFFSIVVEPNLPLLLFTAAMFWAMQRLDATGDPRWWLAVGAFAGLAALSKFLILLLVPAMIVFLLASPATRRSLLTLWPYLGAVLALVAISPVIVWNVQHGWISLAFQGTRLGAGSQSYLLRYLIYELVWVGPVLLVATIVGAVLLLAKGARRTNALDLALSLAVLVPLAFLVWRSLGMQINQSWSWFIWPLGILALTLVLPWGRARRRIAVLIVAVVATGGPLVGAFFYHAAFDRSVWFGAGDPFGQDAGFDGLAPQLLAVAKANDARWIATTEYRIYAALKWQMGENIPVVMVSQRARFLDFAPIDPAALEGRALYVHTGAADPLLEGAALTPLDPMTIAWRDVPMRTIEVDLLEGYVPDLDPAPGSTAYVPVL